jgi:Zn-dependent peptidase ImmA (M78 family)
MFAAFEGDASHLLQAAGIDPDGLVNVRKLVVYHLHSPPKLAHIRREAELAWVNGEPRIFVRAGTPPARARWLACHELAHWWLGKTRQEEAPIAEEQADALGAVIIAPGRAVSRLVRAVGHDPIQIASALETTQSLALLRLGETGHVPAALVEQRRQLLRGEAFRWPDERTLLRALRQEIDGLRRIKITDEPRRIGLVAG